jgi:hypothetical protein
VAAEVAMGVTVAASNATEAVEAADAMERPSAQVCSMSPLEIAHTSTKQQPPSPTSRCIDVTIILALHILPAQCGLLFTHAGPRQPASFQPPSNIALPSL